MRTEFENPDDYHAAKRAYTDETTRLETQFRLDLEEDFGTKGHPKAAKLFGYAWEKGHSSGYNEVYQHYSELVDLVL